MPPGLAPAFFAWRAAKIATIFHAHYPVETPITEIGCGLGKNLILLAYAGYTRLTSLDPTDSAIQAVREQGEWFGQPWQADKFDLLNPDPAILDRLAGRVLFTNHVIEQLPGHTWQALNCLLRAHPAEVIHIEPCAELLAPARSATDLASWLHIIAADYQRTLLTNLNELVAQGRAEILEAWLPLLPTFPLRQDRAACQYPPSRRRSTPTGTCSSATGWSACWPPG